MGCSCCQPPEIGDLEEVFDASRANGEADAYLRAGLEARAERLIAYLLENGAGPLHVLDIGSGAGSVHYELLRRGFASSAVGVEASSAYIAAARSVGERLKLDGQVQYVHGEFTAAAQEINAADAVILDRVICCYPHLDELVTASARKAERYLALSFPREALWVRMVFGMENLWWKLNGQRFRTFMHAHKDVNSIAAREGLKPVHADREGYWQITVFERI